MTTDNFHWFWTKKRLSSYKRDRKSLWVLTLSAICSMGITFARIHNVIESKSCCDSIDRPRELILQCFNSGIKLSTRLFGICVMSAQRSANLVAPTVHAPLRTASTSYDIYSKSTKWPPPMPTNVTPSLVEDHRGPRTENIYFNSLLNKIENLLRIWQNPFPCDFFWPSNNFVDQSLVAGRRTVKQFSYKSVIRWTKNRTL